MAKKNTVSKKKSLKKISTMLQATAMTNEDLTSIATLGGNSDVADVIEAEKAIEDAHKQLDNEANELSLENDPIYESTAIEINKKLNDELEQCKARCAELIEEKEQLQKNIEDIQKMDMKPFYELSAKHSVLSKNYFELQEKYSSLQEKYDRDIEACKIQLEDADRNYQIYDENELNYKVEIQKLKTEIKNLEIALEDSQEKLKQTIATPIMLNSTTNSPQQRVKALPKMPTPTNGYSSWN